MSIELATPLKTSDLEIGRTYQFRQGGRRFEVRVWPDSSAQSGDEESGEMLERWREFPPLPAQFRMQVLCR